MTTHHAPSHPVTSWAPKARPVKVLLALDGSEASLTGRDLVASLDWPSESTIHLVTGYHVPVDWTGGVGATMDWIGDLEDQYRDELVDELKTMAEPLVERGLATVPHAIRGRPATVIVQAARELDVDLVVIGSRGHGRLHSMLLGSVATEVCTDAPCSVLVARSGSARRVLVATDGSDTARAIPHHLATLGIFEDLPCDVVSVLVRDPGLFQLFTGLYTLGDDRLRRMREGLEEQRQAALDSAIGDLAATGVAATPHAAEGDPAHEIIAMAEQCRSDLIVTGDRGLRGLERMVLGSVARNLLTHATASVLVTRPDLQAAPSAGRTAHVGAIR